MGNLIFIRFPELNMTLSRVRDPRANLREALSGTQELTR